MDAPTPPLRHRCVRVQEADFDLSAEVGLLREADLGAGAVVSFVGVVREWLPVPPAAGAMPTSTAPTAPTTPFSHDGDGARGRRLGDAGVLAPPALILEHYPGMTERSIDAMVDEASRRFALRGARIIHRVGPLALGEQIVLVAVSAAHRHAAFQGCEFLMDWLKTQAPFWKKEVHGGQGQWVDAREQDDQALARWGGVPGVRGNAGQGQAR